MAFSEVWISSWLSANPSASRESSEQCGWVSGSREILGTMQDSKETSLRAKQGPVSWDRRDSKSLNSLALKEVWIKKSLVFCKRLVSRSWKLGVNRLCPQRLFGGVPCSLPGQRLGHTGGMRCCQEGENEKGEKKNWQKHGSVTRCPGDFLYGLMDLNRTFLLQFRVCVFARGLESSG